MLNPLLSPSLILAVQCRTPQSNGTCSATNFNDTTAFRFGSTASGLDGLTLLWRRLLPPSRNPTSRLQRTRRRDRLSA